jgi:glycosyltransferase involved in cell wall biosynthesis
VRVGVCDFPSRYAFPPRGYGGIERWLWAVAVGAERAGANVTLLGPTWRDDLPPQFGRLPVRLEDIRPGQAALAALQHLDLDLLVVGHEYPSLPAWRETFARLDCDLVTFQHDPVFAHAPDAFDGQQRRLFCYSLEMIDRYAAHRPIQTLSVQFGLEESEALPAARGTNLLWLGRIDGQKAPHLAAMAAGTLGRQVRLVGPVLDNAYLRDHEAALTASHVELVGELAGKAKLKALQTASALVYTCQRGYVEAGAAVFGEALRSGTAVAALTWTAGTCAEAALCPATGIIAQVDADDSDEVAASRLAEAITAAELLDVRQVQAIGLARFDPVTHFRALAGPADPWLP